VSEDAGTILEEIAARAGEAKSQAKHLPGSVQFVDRRALGQAAA
jgi:hypothetical protein